MNKLRALLLVLSLFIVPVVAASPTQAATVSNYVCHNGQYTMGTLQILNAKGQYMNLPPYKCSQSYVGFSNVIAFRTVRSTCRFTSIPWKYAYPALKWNYFGSSYNVLDGYVNCMI